MTQLDATALSQVHGGSREGDTERQIKCAGSTFITSAIGATGGAAVGGLFHRPPTLSKTGALIGAAGAAVINLSIGDGCENVTHPRRHFLDAF